MLTTRALVALAGMLLAGLFTVGCGLSLVSERQRSGGESDGRDEGRRALALVGWAVLGLACFGSGLVLWQVLLPGGAGWVLVVYVVGVLGSLGLLGLLAR